MRSVTWTVPARRRRRSITTMGSAIEMCSCFAPSARSPWKCAEPCSRNLPFASVRNQLEELEQHAGIVVLGHEGAAPLPADEVLRRHFVERLSDCPLADAEIGGQLRLAREQLTRSPHTVGNPPHEGVADLAVERSEAYHSGGDTLVLWLNLDHVRTASGT